VGKYPIAPLAVKPLPLRCICFSGFRLDRVEIRACRYNWKTFIDMETAIEEDDIGERMDRGRLALLKEGRNEVGPHPLPFEDGMQHFHEFYCRIVGSHIAA
jgi:hypothetical protein